MANESAAANRTTAPRPRAVVALTLLLGAQYVGVGGLFPYYAFARTDSSGLRGLALALVSCKLTVDLFNWALALDRTLLPLSEVVNGGIIALAFTLARPQGRRIAPAQRAFYGCVLALALLVAFRGLATPARSDEALPFLVPPLHARFLGAMYLSGAVFLLLGIRAADWSKVRVMTPMIAVWTGALGLISLLHLDAFDWTRGQVWVWFIAYCAFPLIAAWLTWRHRGSAGRAAGPPLSAPLRGYLALQGLLLLALAWLLLLAAPFLSYGLGSLCAARQRGWAEVRIVVCGTLAFTLGVLAVSFHHRARFHFDSLAPWLWFGGFGLGSLALALFWGLPALRHAGGAGARAPRPAPTVHDPHALPGD